MFEENLKEKSTYRNRCSCKVRRGCTSAEPDSPKIQNLVNKIVKEYRIK